MKLPSKTLCIAFFTGFVFSLYACTGIGIQDVAVQDGKRHGFSDGTFRAKWWSYYNRGIYFAQEGDYDKAIEDLQSAIARRSEDQWRARTYGMHFTDYFPHRELGIVYYKLGRLDEAGRELEESLSTGDSAKAKYYLNLVRKEIIARNALDKSPPVLTITGPAQARIFTNRLDYTIAGRADGDNYISAVMVDGIPVLLELSAKVFNFETGVALKEGLNRIAVTAKDLADRMTAKELEIVVDRQGPLIAIGEAGIKDGRGYVKGALFDNYGIARYVINGREVSVSKDSIGKEQDIAGGKVKEFTHGTDKEISVEEGFDLTEGTDSFSITAWDMAGNSTTALISLAQRDQKAWKKECPLYASAGVWDGEDYQSAGHCTPCPPKRGGTPSLAGIGLSAALQGLFDSTSPVISLKDMADGMEVYTDHLLLEGSVSDDTKLKSFLINNQEMLGREFKIYYFSNLIGLKEGDNTIVLTATDSAGNKAEKTLKVVRKVQKVRQVGSRMTVGFLPFEIKGEGSVIAKTVYDKLLGSFVTRKRFNMIEKSKMDDVLRELKLSATALVNPATAVRAGKLAASETMLTGSVVETKEGLEVIARLIDTESSLLMATENVFIAQKDLKELERLSDVLAFKFARSLPLVEGIVIKADEKDVMVDIGADARLKEGMRVYLFKEGEAIKHPVSGKVLGAKDEILGEAKVKGIEKEYSTAEILKKNAAFSVKDRVITK